jgi:hypothetical protein
MISTLHMAVFIDAALGQRDEAVRANVSASKCVAKHISTTPCGQMSRWVKHVGKPENVPCAVSKPYDNRFA